MQTAMSYGNVIFSAIFTCEMITKVIAYKPRGYWADSWNKFDFLVVIVSWVGVAIDFGTPTYLPFLSLLRIVRIFKLVRFIEGLKVREESHAFSTIQCTPYQFTLLR